MIKQSSGDRPLWVKLILLGVSFGLVISFVGLGNWQMRRLDWKLDRIDKINERAYLAPQVPPSGGVTFQDHAYMRLKVTGRFLAEKTVLVKAVTELGMGYWVMTPLVRSDQIIWVNRGFVPPSLKSPEGWVQPAPHEPVVGLLRLTEPEGTLLEANNPDKDQWFSRDIEAMSARMGLTNVAAYFIDQEKNTNIKTWPRAGLTVLKFNNPHLSYALTWYAMALLFAGALVYVVRYR